MVMKKLLIAALAASTLLLTGCPATPEDIARAKQATVESFSNPERVGVLSDGREIRRVIVSRANRHDQFVYFVDNATVSTNYAVQSGKTTFNQTNVALSTKPTNEEILRAAEQIKTQIDEAEEAEYQRLKLKRGHE